MTTTAAQIELQPRELLGKKVSRLRRTGIIPVHLYGPGIQSRALQSPAPPLIQALAAAGASSPIQVTIHGEPGAHLAFAREIQWDPKRDTILHVDLLAADIARPVTAQVPIALAGEAPGALQTGGAVTQQLQHIEVSALPLNLPAQIQADLTAMTTPDSALRAADLPLPPGATLTSDPDEIVARIDLPRNAEPAP